MRDQISRLAPHVLSRPAWQLPVDSVWPPPVASDLARWAGSPRAGRIRK